MPCRPGPHHAGRRRRISTRYGTAWSGPGTCASGAGRAGGDAARVLCLGWATGGAVGAAGEVRGGGADPAPPDRAARVPGHPAAGPRSARTSGGQGSRDSNSEFTGPGSPYLDCDAERAYLTQIIKDDDLVSPSWRTASSVGSSDPAHLASRGMWSRHALRQAGSLDRDKAQLTIEGHLLCRRS